MNDNIEEKIFAAIVISNEDVEEYKKYVMELYEEYELNEIEDLMKSLQELTIDLLRKYEPDKLLFYIKNMKEIKKEKGEEK